MKHLIVIAVATVILLTMAFAASPAANCPLKGTPACPEYPACCVK
jgi:hypothetical protein